MAAMKAAMQNIKDGLQGMNDEDILSKLEKKALAKKDAGLTEEEAADLMDGMDAGSEGEVEVEMGEPRIESRKSRDGGVEVEIKKPIELSRKTDGGVEVEAGEVKIEKRVSPAQKSLDFMKKGIDGVVEDSKKSFKEDLQKLKEGVESVKKKPLFPEVKKFRKNMDEVLKDAGVDAKLLNDEDVDSIVNFIKKMKGHKADAGE